METLDTLYPAFCLADCQRIDLMAANSPYPVPMHKVTLQSGQQGFREVMELLEGRSYRRSALRRISDKLLKGHTWREGGFPLGHQPPLEGREKPPAAKLLRSIILARRRGLASGEHQRSKGVPPADAGSDSQAGG